jgi:hypothetical protein
MSCLRRSLWAAKARRSLALSSRMMSSFAIASWSLTFPTNRSFKLLMNLVVLRRSQSILLNRLAP